MKINTTEALLAAQANLRALDEKVEAARAKVAGVQKELDETQRLVTASDAANAHLDEVAARHLAGLADQAEVDEALVKATEGVKGASEARGKVVALKRAVQLLSGALATEAAPVPAARNVVREMTRQHLEAQRDAPAARYRTALDELAKQAAEMIALDEMAAEHTQRDPNQMEWKIDQLREVPIATAATSHFTVNGGRGAQGHVSVVVTAEMVHGAKRSHREALARLAA